MTTRKEWREILADGLSWGLGDVEIHREVAVYHHDAAKVELPCAVISQGDLAGNYEVLTKDSERGSMCKTELHHTIWLCGGRPYDTDAHDTIDLWLDRLPAAFGRCKTDPRNMHKERPRRTRVYAPTGINVGGVDVLAAPVEISISYHNEPT